MWWCNNRSPKTTQSLGSSITSLAFAKGGNRLVVGCTTEMIVFDTLNATPRFIHNQGVDNLYEVDISSDGNYIISIDNASTLRFFNLSQTVYSTPQWSASLTPGMDKDIVLASGGSKIGVSGPTHNITLYNTTSSVPSLILPNYSKSIDPSADGELMGVGIDLNATRIWANGTMKDTFLLMGASKIIDISENGENMLSIGNSFPAYVNLYNQTSSTTMDILSHEVMDAGLSDDGNITLVGTLGNYSHMYGTGLSYFLNRIYTDSAVQSVAISEAGDCIALGLNSSKIMYIGTPQSPGSFSLTTNYTGSAEDGRFTLNWTAAFGAVNYSVYQYSSLITEINASLTVLATGNTNRSMILTQSNNSVRFYCVVAENNLGSRISNILPIQMVIPSQGGTTSGTTTETTTETSSTTTTTDDSASDLWQRLLDLLTELSWRNPLLYLLLGSLIYGLYKAFSGGKKPKVPKKFDPGAPTLD